MTVDDARENFMSDVYNTLDFLPTNNEANRIIDSFDRVTSGLNQQPCDDCISRQAVLEQAMDYGSSTYLIPVNAIKTLPPVTPKEKTGWIPVSEQVPEDTYPVNITWVNHAPEPYYATIKDKPFTATGHYCDGKWYWYSVTCQDYLDEYGRYDVDAMDEEIEVIAWMPLPAPFEPQESKKGENNDRSNQETKSGAGCGGDQGI